QANNEALLLESLKAIREQDVDEAINRLAALTEQQPDFKLAQLIYADLMAARGTPLHSLGKGGVDQKKLDGFISEAKARMLMETEKPSADMIPASMIQLAPNQKYALVMDARLHRLFVFENQNGTPVMVKDYYASYGRGGVDKYKEGDLKTPLGVYFVTGRLLDENLPPRYGSGALPINYPNVWDEREGRTGYGIWVHGSPVDTYSRPPAASEGCISLSNVDFTELDNMLDVDATPVIIGHNVRWMQRDDWAAQQEEYSALIETWRGDWESLDNDRYLRHYSKQYKSGTWGYSKFVEHKRRVNAQKSYVKVGIDQLSLFRHPDNPDLLIADFRQDYQSSNYKGRSKKRQYWLNENGTWRIAYEGKPSRGKP
ncbi:MAG: L,D-transpeptidase family protein, partial [Pontibacterium sp.]